MLSHRTKNTVKWPIFKTFYAGKLSNLIGQEKFGVKTCGQDFSRHAVIIKSKTIVEFSHSKEKKPLFLRRLSSHDTHRDFFKNRTK